MTKGFTTSCKQGQIWPINNNRQSTSGKAFFGWLKLISTCTRMMRRKKYGEGLEQPWNMIQSIHHHLRNMDQCDGMSVHAGYCCLVMMMMRQNRRQKQPDEYWSVQGFTTRYSINGQIHITYSKSNPGVFEGKKVEYSVSLLISTWLSSISLAEDKTKDRKTHKPTTTEVICSKDLRKHHKEGNPVSADVHEIQT